MQDLRGARRAAAVAVALATLVGSTMTAANAGTLNDGNTQYFGTTDYYASMSLRTTAHFSGGGATAHQDGALSNGGAYFYGPYGGYGVQASNLKHTWNIILDGTSGQNCSIGYPGGFSCTYTADKVTMKKSTDFGSSMPSSTSLGERMYTVKSGSGRWLYIQFDSNWRVRRSINGTIHERNVSASNRHAY